MKEKRIQKFDAILGCIWWRQTKGVIKKIGKFIWKWKFILFFIIIAFNMKQIVKYKSDEYCDRKCGKIEDMKQITDQKAQTIKNLIYIRYGEEIEQREVDDNTYYNHKKGDDICFNAMKPEYISSVILHVLSAFIFGIWLIVIFFVRFVGFE